MTATAHAGDAGYAHPTWQLNTKIAITLFVLMQLTAKVDWTRVFARAEAA